MKTGGDLQPKLGSFRNFGQQRKGTRRSRRGEAGLRLCGGVGGGAGLALCPASLPPQPSQRRIRPRPGSGLGFWCHRMDDATKCSPCWGAAGFWRKAKKSACGGVCVLRNRFRLMTRPAGVSAQQSFFSWRERRFTAPALPPGDAADAPARCSAERIRPQHTLRYIYRCLSSGSRGICD